MKRLSLSILLLCLFASNAQAFSPWKWTKKKLEWVKDNKKKVIAGTATLGLASCLGYKAHKAYPDLNILKATQKLVAENNWSELLDAEKLTGKDSWPLYIVNTVGLSFLFSQKVLPSVFNTATINFDKYFNKNFDAQEEFKLRFTILRSQQKDILNEMKVDRIARKYTPLKGDNEIKQIEQELKDLVEDFRKNRQQEEQLRSQAEQLLGEKKANNMFNELLSKNS